MWSEAEHRIFEQVLVSDARCRKGPRAELEREDLIEAVAYLVLIARNCKNTHRDDPEQLSFFD